MMDESKRVQVAVFIPTGNFAIMGKGLDIVRVGTEARSPQRNFLK
jgi:hypothetical protein